MRRTLSELAAVKLARFQLYGDYMPKRLVQELHGDSETRSSHLVRVEMRVLKGRVVGQSVTSLEIETRT